MATKLGSRPAAVKDLYHEAFVAWSSEQASLLRTARFAELNLAHFVEEVEDWGHGERDAVRSQVRRILEQLLKLEHSLASEPRDGWKDPTLKADLETTLPRLYVQMLPKVRRALRRFGEQNAAGSLPSICPCTLDEICRAEWLPANRRGVADEPD